MKKSLLALAALGTLAAPAFADDTQLLDEAHAIPARMVPKLLEVLSAEIAKGGQVAAIPVCRDRAPQMAKALSEQTGWSIRRVSLKNRNPKAVPDAWERGVLEEFDRRLAAGEDPAKIEKFEIVSADGQRTARYMKALPTQELCLSCHGTPEKMSAEVKDKLKELYPDDQATGYGARQIRGAITAKKAL
ncbi:MAG TPA: DUF3365 domain-containing protein [Rhodocyclaceae bacterium]